MGENQLRLFTNKDSSKKRRFISIPVDTLVLIIILNLLAVAIIYSWGVRRGMHLAKSSMVAVDNTLIPQKENRVVSPSEGGDNLYGLSSLEEKGKKDENEGRILASNEGNVKEKESIPFEEHISKKQQGKDKYFIQVASYLKKDIAKKEKEFLISQGYPVKLLRKGKYLVLYVGGFNSKEEADKIKDSLKKRYQDCFIKKSL